MRDKIVATIVMLFMAAHLLCGKDKTALFYPTVTIDSSLKKDAWAVCREYRHEFHLAGNGKAIERVHRVVTVLEKNGSHFGDLILPYDKLRKINSISGKSYTWLGLPDDKLKNNAIRDVNYTSAGAIYDDLRLKTASITGDTFPYTVEYNFEIEYDEMIIFPEWQPLSDYRLSVEKSTFLFTCPDTMKFRYREFHMPANSRSEKRADGLLSIEWKVDSIKAWREEPYSPEMELEAPHVITAPARINFGGYPGSMNSWKDFGHWFSQLLEGRDQLPVQRQSEIREMVKEVKDTVEIVQKLYEYMQKRTRYVGIQLGIGGLQPFPAETVDRLGYGDCKALSNYMSALLKSAGIRSIYTVAGAGPSQGITMDDFPTITQANHVILCVPLQKDSIWLECTSQTTPCGYMSPFTAGRKALHITSNGGRVVRTPLLTANQSSQFCNADLMIKSDGSVEGTLTTSYSGYQYDNISKNLTESREEQEKTRCSDLSITGLVIKDINYKVNKGKIPQATETITISTPIFATRTGSRLFIPLNIFNQVKSAPQAVDNRRMPVYRSFAFTDKDSVIIRLPAGFNPESIPRGRKIVSEFGEYTSTITASKEQAVYFRELKMNRGTWPKERYSALVDFYNAIINADKVKLVLKEDPK